MVFPNMFIVSESEFDKIIATMYKKTDCAHCDDLNTFFNDSQDKLSVPLEYSTYDENTDAFKDWAKTNVPDVPASKICTVDKTGKQDCQTYVGVDDAKTAINKYLKK